MEEQNYFLELQFTHLKNRGVLPENLTLDQYKELNYEIWPPGTPLPKNDRDK